MNTKYIILFILCCIIIYINYMWDKATVRWANKIRERQYKRMRYEEKI